ncbi:hypothetical protein [Mycobacteroides abscessus]|uniref:hypothetical protein n=1 Tax=Mycobacteroides abscessus TaxID=36809 RepID=UPI002105DD6C|nr:hypothetical protein [Mycobacteroides abscessus]
MTTPASEVSIQPPAPPALPEPAATVEEVTAAPTPEVDVEPVPGDALPAVRLSADVAIKWEHDFLEFGGDKLEIRVPTPQAMSALSMGMGKYVPAKMKNDLSGLFLAYHLSPESYEHMYSRLMNPNDTGCNANTIGELIGAILTTGVERFEAASKAAEDEAKK